MNSSYNHDYTSFLRQRTSSVSSQQSPLDFTTSSINSLSMEPGNDWHYASQNEEKLYELFPKPRTALFSPNSKYTSNQTTYSLNTLENDTKLTNDVNSLMLPRYSSMFNMPPPSPYILSPSYYQDYSIPSNYYSTDSEGSPAYNFNINANLSASSTDCLESEYNSPYTSPRNRNISTNSIEYSDFDYAFSNLSMSELNPSVSPNTDASSVCFGSRTLKNYNLSEMCQSSCCQNKQYVCQTFQNNSNTLSSSSSSTTIDQYPKTTICTFCRKNNERPSVYLTHLVRETVGNKKVVTCPILRSYVCPDCKVSGDNAHTRAYCPKNKKHNSRMPSITIALKNTRIQSKGTKKY